MAFAVEHQPSAKVVAGRELRHLSEHHLEALNARQVIAQPPIAHRGTRFAIITCLGEAEPDPP